MYRYLIVLLAMLLPLEVFAISAEDVMKKSQAAFLYQGKDFKARVMMKLINKGGQEENEELTMLRKNFGEAGGEQKFFMYFVQPADVKDMTFMVYKYPARDDDRWLFVPAINMVRRIAAQDKTSSLWALTLPMKMSQEGTFRMITRNSEGGKARSKGLLCREKRSEGRRCGLQL